MRLLSVVVVLALPVVAQAQQTAVVDMHRALTSSLPGVRAQSELRLLHARYQESLDAQQSELRELRAKVASAPQAERATLEHEYRQRLVALQQAYTQMQQDLAAQEQQRTSVIVADIRRHAEALRRERGLSVVIELQNGQQPPSGRGAAADLTQQVIERLNAADVAAHPGTPLPRAN